MCVHGRGWMPVALLLFRGPYPAAMFGGSNVPTISNIMFGGRCHRCLSFFAGSAERIGNTWLSVIYIGIYRNIRMIWY